jgi:ABC-type transport system involved in multi-copper enzyme maturation permease subunit
LLALLCIIACTIPLASALMLLGGIEGKTILGVTMVTMGVAILASTLALALSVSRGRTHEVTFATYAILSLVFFLDPLAVCMAKFFRLASAARPGLGGQLAATGFEVLNPFWLALAPYYRPATARLEEPSLFLVASALIGFLLTAFSIVKLNRFCARGMQTKTRRRSFRKEPWQARILRPLLDRNPVVWLDLRSGTGRPLVIRLFCGAVIIGLMGLVTYENYGSGNWNRTDVALANSIQICLGLLLVSISAASRFGEDRANGTLGTLLVTPLSSRSIVLGKWLGAFRWVPWLAIFPCAAFFFVSDMRANTVDILLIFMLILAYGSAMTSVGLCLVTAIPNVSRAVGTTVGIFVFYCVGTWMLANFSPYVFGQVFGLVLVLSPIGLMAVWGFSVIASTFKNDLANAILAYIFVGALIVAAILLPPIARACIVWDPWASVRIKGAAFLAMSIAGFGLMKRTAPISKDNAYEFGLFALLCACWLPVLIGCLEGAWVVINWSDGWEWEKGITYASPWAAGGTLMSNAMSKIPSLEATPWVLFWTLSFASVGAFLLRATQVSLDHHFERAHHL